MSENKLRITVLSGAGVSADSGLKTFRDHDGLWENYNVYEVATPEAWHMNKDLVLEFYNKRRSDVKNASPNAGHRALADLEDHFDVQVITQNIDDLHERAGSKNVLHLHGEIFKARSTADDTVFPIAGTELNPGDTCPLGSQLRPHIVWFGEEVPMLEKAIPLFETADIVIVAGTSLEVYPAAGLIQFARKAETCILVDPKMPPALNASKYTWFNEKAATGLPKAAAWLRQRFG